MATEAFLFTPAALSTAKSTTPAPLPWKPSSFMPTSHVNPQKHTVSLSLSPSFKLSASPVKPLFHPLRLRVTKHQSNGPKPRICVCSHSTQTPSPSASTEQPFLTGSTRTVTTLATLAFSLSRLFIGSLQRFASTIPMFPNLNQLLAQRTNMVQTAGPLFFAKFLPMLDGKENVRRAVDTPLTVVALGLAKWLDIYNGILMVRVLLSWFPNIPWDRQPLSAIRDLCDPYLSLFRGIVPPVFGSLDVSPILAFFVLGMLSAVLNNSTFSSA